MKIVEMCNRNVVTTVARASLADVAKLMRESHVGSVIVVEAVAADLDARSLSAGEVMSRKLARVCVDRALGRGAGDRIRAGRGSTTQGEIRVAVQGF